MTENPFDFLIEAVKYTPDGQIQFVRLYERRGPSFSDRVIYQRDQLENVLSKGRKVVTGTRIHQLASTFEISGEVSLINKEGINLIQSGEAAGNTDQLQSVPIL